MSTRHQGTLATGHCLLVYDRHPTRWFQQRPSRFGAYALDMFLHWLFVLWLRISPRTSLTNFRALSHWLDRESNNVEETWWGFPHDQFVNERVQARWCSPSRGCRRAMVSWPWCRERKAPLPLHLTLALQQLSLHPQQDRRAQATHAEQAWTFVLLAHSLIKGLVHGSLSRIEIRKCFYYSK